jgi:hypothetical protein
LSDPELLQQWRREPQQAPSQREQLTQLAVVMGIALLAYLLICGS